MKKEKKEFQFPTIPEVQLSKQPPKQSVVQELQGRPSKMNFTFSYELIEKIKDYAYMEGFTQQQVVAEAIELFFKDKSIESRPEALKNRPRPGRKPKNF